MQPLLGNGDVAIVDRAAYAGSSPRRGDLVLMLSPEDPSHQFVKRVIALPGDMIQIDGRYVDAAHPGAAPRTAVLIKPGGAGRWQTLMEPYLPDQGMDPWDELNNCCDADGRATAIPTPLTIPDGDYFVLGDNRNRSADSRYFGLRPLADIEAKVLYRVRGGSTTWLYQLVPHLSGAI